MVATAAPLVAQGVMLVTLLAMRRWAFALMIVPSLIGCAAMLLVRSAQPTATGPDPAQAPSSAVGTPHADDGSDDAARFGLIRPSSLERLLALERGDDPLPWRTIARRWLEPGSLDVPVGMGEDGEFRLDLAGQGPHALVAGTTGSGKSVLLQSWCLALACRNPPDALRFVFLDFKGGSAFRALEGLPHCVGSVNDLDLGHAARALHAIEHELRRRERLVAHGRAQDVDGLREPPPRLVIMVDEFHALKDQLPDTVDRLVRIASLGRALGMHVVACTQHPSGQVSAEMKANMTLGLCLRVRDGMQSTELIGDARAARIPPSLPGAAYRADGETVRAWRCAACADIPRLTDAIATAARFHGCVPPPALFTAPLPRRLATLPAVRAGAGMPFGLKDDGMTLAVAYLPVDRGNIGVIGQHGRGKTNLLAVLARHLTETPAETPVAVRFTSRDARGYRTRTLRPIGPASRARRYDATGAGGPPRPPRAVWIVDDAGPLFDPFGDDPLCAELRRALDDHRTTVVFAVETSRHVRIPDHCPFRVVFPTADRAADLMNGIPADLWASMGDDMTSPGRAALIGRGCAAAVQCVLDRGR
ncbi:cell division protein FtsK [Bifidobacterium sp. SMA15]|uniref:Cell division protein FtsK n=2 Tax=Bifidobacterium platyrrhinorum TaxID=2661628 RepID=A0A6L9ST69_9BIFI|nr:cell division protein FtsK [Bifidobacterium platyrrhinorum]